MCHAKAGATLGFCMGILTKKKVLDFVHREQGHFGGQKYNDLIFNPYNYLKFYS